MSDFPTRQDPTPAKLSAGALGSIEFNCMGVDFGFKSVSNIEESRNASAMYVQRVSDAKIIVRIHHKTREDYIAFNDWLLKYARAISTPDNSTPPVTISVPSIMFQRVGIPEQAGEFGDRAKVFSYEQTVRFSPSSDYLGVGQRLPSNSPQLPDDPEEAARYPTSPQLVGDQHLENALYDTAPVTEFTDDQIRGWGFNSPDVTADELTDAERRAFAESFGEGFFG